jgi:hypothetical protein
MASDICNPQSLRFPKWQSEVQAAILETDPNKLQQCLDAAEAAIFFRLQALEDYSDGHTERQAPFRCNT